MLWACVLAGRTRLFDLTCRSMGGRKWPTTCSYVSGGAPIWFLRFLGRGGLWRKAPSREPQIPGISLCKYWRRSESVCQIQGKVKLHAPAKLSSIISMKPDTRLDLSHRHETSSFALVAGKGCPAVH